MTHPGTYEEAVTAYLEWEAQAAEGEAYEHRSNFRPDETDLARDRAIEREFERSEREIDPTMRGEA